MSSYYYLMAQLPVLIYDQKPPMSSEHFKALAESLLSKKDAKYMRCLSLDPNPTYTENEKGTSYTDKVRPTGCKFIDGWRDWERTLRINLLKHRAHNLKRDSEIPAEVPVVPMEASIAAAKATSDELSPLEAEMLIDKARWITICNIAGHNYFGRDNVFAYYLKLVLMERKESFNTEKGFSEYKTLYASILENASKTESAASSAGDK